MKRGSGERLAMKRISSKLRENRMLFDRRDAELQLLGERQCGERSEASNWTRILDAIRSWSPNLRLLSWNSNRVVWRVAEDSLCHLQISSWPAPGIWRPAYWALTFSRRLPAEMNSKSTWDRREEDEKLILDQKSKLFGKPTLIKLNWLTKFEWNCPAL